MMRCAGISDCYQTCHPCHEDDESSSRTRGLGHAATGVANLQQTMKEVDVARERRELVRTVPAQSVDPTKEMHLNYSLSLRQRFVGTAKRSCLKHSMDPIDFHTSVVDFLNYLETFGSDLDCPIMSSRRLAFSSCKAILCGTGIPCRLYGRMPLDKSALETFLHEQEHVPAWAISEPSGWKHPLVKRPSPSQV